MTIRSTFMRAKEEFIKDLNTLMTQKLKSLHALTLTPMVTLLQSVTIIDSIYTVLILKGGSGRKLYASRYKTIIV